MLSTGWCFPSLGALITLDKALHHTDEESGDVRSFSLNERIGILAKIARNIADFMKQTLYTAI